MDVALQCTSAALAATVGNMLEFYDFITHSFFAIQIGHSFLPTQSEYRSLMLSPATVIAARMVQGFALDARLRQ